MATEDANLALEKAWHREMLQIYADAKAINYNASYFIRMVEEMGGLAAAKRLINDAQPSDGFTRLWELGRLDISVEARALKPEHRPLFSSEEINGCRRRLADYQWTKQPPWDQPD